MLIQCKKCGRPVYDSGKAGTVECIYCYEQNSRAGSTEMKPDDLNWWDPIVLFAMESWKRKWATDWLRLMGRDKEVQAIESRWAEIEKEWKDAVKAAEDAWTNSQDEKEIQTVMRRLQDLPESTAVQEWIDRLRRKLKKIWAGQEIARLAHQAEETRDEDGLARIERELRGLIGYDGAEEALETVTEKKNGIIRDRLAAEKAAIRRKRMKWIRRGMVAFACAAAIVIYGLVSRHSMQPGWLEQARSYAKDGAWEQAEQSYLVLSEPRLFVNTEVREAAETELKTLRNEWAESLVTEGQWERAIELLEKAGNRQRADEVRGLYGEALAAEGEWKEAISMLQKLTGYEDRVLQLYTAWTLELAAGGQYEDAISKIENADQEALAAEGITTEWLYGELGKKLEDGGNLRKALVAYRKAGSDEWVQQRIETLQTRQVLEESELLLAMWREATEEEKPELLKEMAGKGSGFTSVDQQLQYWSLLSKEGVDLTRVFPEGAVVTGIRFPQFTSEDTAAPDTTRPLVLVREENSYDLQLSGMGAKTEIHERNDESCFTLRLMPEFWQKLPEDRRAASLADCTCILLAESYYRASGSAECSYTVKDYVHEMVAKQNGTFGKSGYRDKTLRYSVFATTFTAVQEIRLWNYPDPESTLVANRSDKNRNSSTNIDWRTGGSLSYGYEQLGFSGRFSRVWVKEELAAASAAWR